MNSVTLKEAIVSICDGLAIPLPDKISFFRWFLQFLMACEFCHMADMLSYFDIGENWKSEYLGDMFVGHKCRQLLQEHAKSLAKSPYLAKGYVLFNFLKSLLF